AKIIDGGIADGSLKEGPDFKIRLLSDEQVKGRIVELAEIFGSDVSEERLRYNTRKASVAEELKAKVEYEGVKPMDVHRAVMEFIRGKKEEKRELTQGQKMVSLALDSQVQLWTDPGDGVAYVSVIVGQHCENFRVGGGEFENWVRGEFGRRHWT